MQFVVVLDIPDEVLDGVEDIDHACTIVEEELSLSSKRISICPLSEVIAC